MSKVMAKAKRARAKVLKHRNPPINLLQCLSLSLRFSRIKSSSILAGIDLLGSSEFRRPSKGSSLNRRLRTKPSSPASSSHSTMHNSR